jgi:hypothetical protein
MAESSTAKVAVTRLEFGTCAQKKSRSPVFRTVLLVDFAKTRIVYLYSQMKPSSAPCAEVS